MLEMMTERLEERIFQWVVIEGSSAVKIAGDLSLREDDVIAICEKQRWRALGRRFPAPRQQMLSAWYLHLRRLEYLYQTVMSAWEASAAERGVVQQGPDGTEVKYETQQGKAGYLLIAAKISREQALAETALAKLRAQWGDEVEDGEGQILEQRREREGELDHDAKQESFPPASGLARQSEMTGFGTPVEAQHDVASDALASACGKDEEERVFAQAPKAQFSNPVRAGRNADGAAMPREVKAARR